MAILRDRVFHRVPIISDTIKGNISEYTKPGSKFSRSLGYLDGDSLNIRLVLVEADLGVMDGIPGASGGC